MTNNWTPEMQAAVMGELGAIKQGLVQRQKQSAVQSVLASWGDALGDLGQNGAAFVVLWGSGRAVGMAFDTWGFAGWVDFWNGMGLFAGGVTVGARVVLDQLLGELLEFFQSQKENVPPKQEPPRPESAPAEMEMGLQVSDGRGWVTLLHDVPRHRVRKMAHATARGYFKRPASETERNFSQDHLGRFWGAHLNRVKTRLAAAGKIELGSNNTYTFTDAGAEWLERIMTER